MRSVRAPGLAQKARDALRALFADVRTLRPEGTRSSSVEVFLVGLRRKPAVA